MNQLHDDEIDLLDLLLNLWDGKWLISVFVLIAVSLGGSLSLLKDTKYESKMIYSEGTLHPFYASDKAAAEFQRYFTSQKLFEGWKTSNPKASLVFGDLSTKNVVDGVVFSKETAELAEQLASFVNTGRGGFHLSIKTTDLLILNDVFKYAVHINGLLTREYVSQAKNQINIAEPIMKSAASADAQGIALEILALRRYVVSAEKGANVFYIQHPTMPKKIASRFSLPIFGFAILGGIVGAMFVLISNSLRKRKNWRAKA